MFESLSEIKLGEKQYPIKCDIAVLEKIQEKYDSIEAFEDNILTWEKVLDKEGKEIIEKKTDENGEVISEKTKIKGKMPRIKYVNDFLFWVVQEGEMISADNEKREAHKYTRDQVLRLAANRQIMDLASELHDEFYRCLASKNEETTQTQTES